MSAEHATHFSNVDLDIKSRANLGALAAWMERRAVVLQSQRHRGVHFVSIELSSARQATPDTCIAGLARLIEGLPAAERRLWDGAFARIFDIGIQAGADEEVYRPEIKSATLARVAALHAAIVFTVYPFGLYQEPKVDVEPSRKTRGR